MKAWLLAGTVALTVLGAFAASAAAEEGPRPSSENNWPGVSETAPAPGYPAAAATRPEAAAAPHYVWQEGYEDGGKWHGHWTLVP